MRFWSKWQWNIHYWFASEVYANYRDHVLAADGAKRREIPPRTNYNRQTNMSSRSVMVKVASKYTLLGRLWSIYQAPWRSHVPGRRYKLGNSLRCETIDTSRRWDPARFWSKWRWTIAYWVASQVYAKSHDERLAADWATSRRILSDVKFQLQTLKHHYVLQRQFLHVSDQTKFHIYIIGLTLKYMSNTMTNGWLRTEIYTGEFPKMWN